MEDSKRPKVMLECCDDEPIGNLFGIKTKKSPTKVNETVVSGESDRRVVIVGGLDDSLVSMRKKLKGPNNEGDISEGLNDLSNCVVVNCQVKKDVEKGGLSEGFDDNVENKEKNGCFISVKSVEKSDDHGSGLAMDVNDLSNDEVVRCEVKMAGNVVEKDGLENKEKDLSLMSVGSIEKIMGKMGGLNEGIDDGVGNRETDKGSKSVYVTENNDNGNQGSTFKVMEIENLRALVSDKGSKPKLDDNVEDSLSIFLPKAQSVLLEKSGTNMQTEMESETQTLTDGECSHDGSHLPKVEVERSLSSYMDSQKLLDFVKISTDSTSSHDDAVLHQSPDEHMENTSIAGNIVVKIGSSDDCSLQSREHMPTKEGTHNENNGFDPSSSDILLNACTPNDDELFGTTEANGSTSSVSLDHNSDCKEGKGLLRRIESRETSKRKSKRRRHDDMAYEDDADWDGLIQKQGFGECRLAEEDDPSLKENIGAAAVSAGLKVREVAPIEKIKFKDILKRKGGQQEYLKCRNQILALWSKDVTRVLPLTECGVTLNPSINEPPRNSLVREIYKFLNQSGYINAGIASEEANMMDINEDISRMGCNFNEKKRIIVIGAGPAGLTAARHLQRQGFSVDVIEARNRIGGRVYTDKSSLSVPVDLGASIITGIEADVATERRADPSALICAQLGLQLTVLKSDCPLYDIVTGQKVPTDLDDSLEAEYNSLLDDMVRVVAEKGEKAMKMSLEDGLEYALKSRRMSQLGMGRNYKNDFSKDSLSPIERRAMNWHFAHLEYGCAALLQDVSLPFWNQDDIYGGFGGAHCMIKGGYSNVVESLGKGLNIHLNHIVTNITYRSKECQENNDEGNVVKVCTSNGGEFSGDAVLVTVPLGCLKAKRIEFSPPLPDWKELSIQRLGFGVLNKVVMEFPSVFWDDSVDYFGATAEETDLRGKCFMFWNVKKTVGAPILIALVVGKAAIEGQNKDSTDLINHALSVLNKLFGKDIPKPVASVVTDWGNDPFSYGAYSYVAIGSSGEDYDIIGKPVENCLFFAGEATCKEYPDTVGGAMLSGIREAVRISDLMIFGQDYTAEIEEIEAAQRHTDSERNEVWDIIKRLENVTFNKKILLKDMFFSTKTIGGRLLLAKELLNLPVEALKSFAGTKAGLSILNTWILDSMGKDGTQLLRHCVRVLVKVSTDLLAVRLSGVGKTIKEKVCVHTSRDIRAIASQLVNVWIEVFRKEKASRNNFPIANNKRVAKSVKLDYKTDSKMEFNSSSKSQGSVGEEDLNVRDHICIMSEEEKAAFAAAEAARAAALAAAEAYASSEAKCNIPVELPKIPSFSKYAKRKKYSKVDDFDVKKKGGCGTYKGRMDLISETDSKKSRVRHQSTALESTKEPVDNLSHRSRSNEIADKLSLQENSIENEAIESKIHTKAWIDSCRNERIKDFNAIEKWKFQVAEFGPDFSHQNNVVWDEEKSNVNSKPHFDGVVNGSSVSQVTVNKHFVKDLKKAVVDFVASLLMPLYKEKRFDKESYKAMMKKAVTKVMDQTTDAEKAMAVTEFLDSKRKNKIRAFVDKLIEKHMEGKPVAKH